jgi:hypothetical protein
MPNHYVNRVDIMIMDGISQLTTGHPVPLHSGLELLWVVKKVDGKKQRKV